MEDIKGTGCRIYPEGPRKRMVHRGQNSRYPHRDSSRVPHDYWPPQLNTLQT